MNEYYSPIEEFLENELSYLEGRELREGIIRSIGYESYVNILSLALEKIRSEENRKEYGE